MKLVLIDMSFMAHRVKHLMRDLSHGDMPTGVIFGFFESLMSICMNEEIMSNHVMLMFDSQSSYRKKAFSNYKKKRHEELSEEEKAQRAVMAKQMRLLKKEILPDCGFILHQQHGLEADDLIAQAALTARNAGRKAVMVASDHDMLQCLSGDTVVMYDVSRGVTWDEAELWVRKEVTPRQWAKVKCIAGCRGDGVPGIPGVAEKTATSYLLRTLPHHHKKYQAIVSEEGSRTIRRNKPLVKLPHKMTKPIKLEEPEYDAEAFFRWCKKLGLESYLSGARRGKWEGFFSGQMRFERSTPRRRGKPRE